MAGFYKLTFRNVAGDWLGDVTGTEGGFTQLAYTKTLNAPGELTFTLPGDHELVGYLMVDGAIVRNMQVEVWRSDMERGIQPYVDFYGLTRAGSHRTPKQPGTFEVRCEGSIALLADRINAWPAATAGRSRFDNVRAETIMKNLVRYNFTADATTASGRKAPGAMTGLTIEADQGQGVLLDKGNAWANVLAELQEIAPVAGGDFDLVKTGPRAWTFRFYSPHRGTDRRADIVFTPDRDNVTEAGIATDRSNEATVAIVGGRGEESNRDVQTVYASGWTQDGSIEAWVDGRNEGTAAALRADGRAELEQRRLRPELTFSIRQTEGLVYGRDYCEGGVLGDLVRARYRDFTQDRKIVGVSVEVGRGSESISLETQVL